MTFKSFSDSLLKHYKGSGYIGVIREAISKSKSLGDLKKNLIEGGMLEGSYEALADMYK